MKFQKYLNEKSNNGYGITFVDIDETLFNTFAKIFVRDEISDAIITELNNQEFNSYELKDNEYFDFNQFRDGKFFKETSVPIPRTVDMIKKMIHNIETKERAKESRIIFLTARADFDNKQDVINTFEKHGIKIKKPITYIERTGNMKTGTVPEKKKQVILDYLKEGKYRRVRMIDDHKENLKYFLELGKNLPEYIEEKCRKLYDVPENEDPIEFFALYVTPDGKLQKI